MSLTRQDVELAVTQVCNENGPKYSTVAKTLEDAVPILQTLIKNAHGWQFWLMWGMNHLLNVIQDYVAMRHAGRDPLVVRKPVA